MSFTCTSRWRECVEEDDHHRGDPVLQGDGTGLPERRNVQQDDMKILNSDMLMKRFVIECWYDRQEGVIIYEL